MELILYLSIYFLFFPSKKTSGSFQLSNMSHVCRHEWLLCKRYAPRLIYFKENNI